MREDLLVEDSSKEKIIVLYDDTCDVKELQSDSNPLKIVQENIKQFGYKKECKILKGGFKQFFDMYPELCVNKTHEQRNSIKPNKFYFDNQLDQQQSEIENAVMTQITPYLYLGRSSKLELFFLLRFII